MVTMSVKALFPYKTTIRDKPWLLLFFSSSHMQCETPQGQVPEPPKAYIL